jgi:hypothetical protein
MLAAFRGEVYRCLARRRDALFELADAVLCRPGRVDMLAELSLEPECRRRAGRRPAHRARAFTRCPASGTPAPARGTVSVSTPTAAVSAA